MLSCLKPINFLFGSSVKNKLPFGLFLFFPLDLIYFAVVQGRPHLFREPSERERLHGSIIDEQHREGNKNEETLRTLVCGDRGERRKRRRQAAMGAKPQPAQGDGAKHRA